ncbi:MAG TPA: RNA 2',3'-cyclic phosphodiesterase [Candidatus Limnocylindrales bacterium]|nr:RNA 2',3'-cyclic phosphodiesterase [Candidatus Limnocylindrales bacterium]
MNGGRRFVARPPEDPARPRLFFAVPLPEAVREGIRPVRDAVQAGVGDGQARIRWVRIESLHLTVRFLGPTPLADADDLGRAAEIAAREVQPFEVTIAGAGAFPADGRPRTLWLGLRRGADGLGRLVDALGRVLPPAHDERSHGSDHGDGRAFTPHLTIARTDGLRLAGEAARVLAEAAASREWSFVADRMVLFRSHLGEGPAWYEPLVQLPLG